MRKSIKNLSAVTTVGLDIANVCQAQGVDAAGAAVAARSIRRAQVLAFFALLPPCLVAIEACSSAHHWARARNPRDPEHRFQTIVSTQSTRS